MAITLWLALALAAPADAPGTERVFGDWAVACDNVERCQAVAISAAPRGDQATSDLTLTREPGPAGAIRFVFTPKGGSSRVIAIHLDGKRIGSVLPHEGTLTLEGAEAEGLARAMAQGQQLSLRASGQVLARYSLKGSAAMLRYIDGEQGRAGGVTALVARGPKPAASVPAAQALPRIDAVRPPKGKAATLDATAVAKLAAQNGDCDPPARWPAHLKPEFARLDARATLVMVPCHAGPRDSSHLAFVLSGGKAVPARFDFPPSDEKGAPLDAATAPRTIVNYDWSEGTLMTQPFSFYPGACGSVQRWVWDGTRFRLADASRLGVCGRSANWMTVYRAKVAWR